VFRQAWLLQRIVPAIEQVLVVGREMDPDLALDFDLDEALPGGLWDPEAGEVEGGVNRAEGGEEELVE
jgi:hypothetical protein